MSCIYTDLSACPVEKPTHPVLEFPSRSMLGKQFRFNAAWYAEFPWLEYSVSRNTAHCCSCRHFGGHLNKSDKAFLFGFSNWRKGKGKLKKHARSSIHKNTVISWQEYQETAREGMTVEVKITDKSRSEQQITANRHYVGRIIDVISLCAHQDIPLRGHDEAVASTNPGNFRRIFELL